MNVIRARVGNPWFPTTSAAMVFNFAFHNMTELVVQQDDIVIEPIAMPLFKKWLRRKFPGASFTPPTHIALQERPVDSPGYEIADRFVIVVQEPTP
jgi:hypothetical protein